MEEGPFSIEIENNDESFSSDSDISDDEEDLSTKISKKYDGKLARVGQMKNTVVQKILNRRKKKKMIAVISNLLINESNPRYQVTNRAGNIKRQRNYVVQKIMRLSTSRPQYFKRMYRLHVSDFFNLLDKITPILCPNRKHPDTIPPIILLAITLHNYVCVWL